MLPDLLAHYATFPAGAPPHRHITLAACRSFEAAMEQPIDGVPRGVFSWALSRALRRSPADATYRDLLALTRTEMECLPASQRPQLSPAGPGLGDQPILGGPASTATPALVLRWGQDGWRVDAGAAHGTEVGTRMTVVDRGVSREVRLTVVRTSLSLAEPIGWRPDRHRVYRLAVAAAPLAAVTVSVDRDAGIALSEALSSSATVAVTDDAELTVGRHHDDGWRLTDRGATPIRQWPTGTDVVPIAREVGHIARWRQLLQLSNPYSRMYGQVSVELVESLPGEAIAPPDRGPIEPDGEGIIRLTPGRAHFVRLRNQGPTPLHCVLLTLTDTFAVSAALFPGAAVAAFSVAATAEGTPVEFRDAYVWLKLIVSADDIDATPYELPPIGQVWRDLRRVIGLPTKDWWTITVPLIVQEVPRDDRGPRDPGTCHR
jgi:hypothetical protein